MRLIDNIMHRGWRRDLSAYMDGQLDAQRREAMDRHVAECARCREELELMQTVVALLRRVPQVAAPRSFALPSTTPRPVRYTGYYALPLRYATVAAAILLVAVVGVDIVRGQLSAAKGGGQALEQRAEDLQAPTQSLGATSIAPTPPAPMAEAKSADVEATTAGPVGPSAVDNAFRWAKVTLSAVLLVLALVVGAQWWRARRAKARQG